MGSRTNIGGHGGPKTPKPQDVHDSTTCVWKELGFAFLLKNGRFEVESFARDGKYLPEKLERQLEIESNHVESLVASPYHYGAVLKLADGSQEVYI